MDLSLGLVFIVVCFVSFHMLRRRRNLPPGPFRLPLIGSIFFLNKLRKIRLHHLLSDAANRYGNVMSFWLGPQLVVALNGYDAVHEALVKQADVFSGRPMHISFLRKAFVEDGNKGRGILLNDYCYTWRLMRRFTLQVLRDFGVGKTSIEDKVLTEIDAVSKRLVTLEGKSVNISMYLQNIVSNVIFGIVFGRRYEYEDSEFKAVTNMTRVALSGDGVTLGNFLPEFLVKIIYKEMAESDNNVINMFRKMRQYVLQQINDHEATFDKNHTRDFVDLYLKTVQYGSAEDKEGLENEEIFRVIMDLFLAGSETTSTSLDWAILYMSEYLEVQQKCQKEITEAFGDKTIRYADRGKLVYVEATLLEIQRLATVVPVNVFHCTTKDTTLYGYNIPKNTLVFPSIYSTSYDPKYWKEPAEFRPERFIDGTGKLIKNEAMMPFSTGPRQCLGEPLARMELFLVFVNFLQRFTFEPEDKAVKHSLESVIHRVVNSPEPYNVRIYKRT